MMKATTTKGAVVWMVVLLIALLSQATPPAHAEDSHVKGTMILPPTEEFVVPIGERAVMASGAAEDTLNACKAGIPELASTGATPVGRTKLCRCRTDEERDPVGTEI